MVDTPYDEGSESIIRSEHISPIKTNDNIEAKRVANYNWDGAKWNRQVPGMFTAPYDSFYFTNPDGNGNYQTVTSKLSGTIQQTLTLAFDSSNNITSIARN